jgi:y4mF family transcriptional regulator
LFLYPKRYNIVFECGFYTRKGIVMRKELVKFVKHRRKMLGLTQEELAEKAGVGLRFIRDLEQGKETLRMDKVNQVLALFGHELLPVESRRLIDE